MHGGRWRRLSACGHCLNLIKQYHFTYPKIYGHDMDRLFFLSVAIFLTTTSVGASEKAPISNDVREFHEACEWDDSKKVAMLLENDPTLIRAKLDSRYSPLHFATVSGSRNVAQALIERKASVNESNSDGITALHYAVLSGGDRMVSFLLSHGANIEAQTRDKWTPLNLVAWQGVPSLITIARTLLAHKANVHCQAKNGRTPLHEAASYNNEAMVALFLHHNADFRIADKNNTTPFNAMFSSEFHKPCEAVAQLFIAAGDATWPFAGNASRCALANHNKCNCLNENGALYHRAQARVAMITERYSFFAEEQLNLVLPTYPKPLKQLILSYCPFAFSHLVNEIGKKAEPLKPKSTAPLKKESQWY